MELEVEGREGIVLERIDGPTLLEAPNVDPGELPGRLARVHLEIHAHESTELPTRAQKRESGPELPAEVRDSLDKLNAPAEA